MNLPKIRGLVAEKYKTAAEMARQMGWRADKLNRILSGEQKTTTDDVLDMAEALGIIDNPSDVVSIFIT